MFKAVILEWLTDEMKGFEFVKNHLNFARILGRCAYIYEVDFLRFSWNGRRSFGRYGNGRWHPDNPPSYPSFRGGADRGADSQFGGVFAYWCSCPRSAFEEQIGGARQGAFPSCACLLRLCFVLDFCYGFRGRSAFKTLWRLSCPHLNCVLFTQHFQKIEK